MKTKTYILIIFCFVCNLIKAQDIKSQTDELNTIKEGNYTAYLTHKENGNYKGGMENLDYVIKAKEDYKIQPGVHKEVYFIRGGNPERRDSQTTLMFLPDNEAFPITYIERFYEGNKEMQEELGYVQRVNRHADGNRLVFLDGLIYIISNWQDKDNYDLQAVLEFEEKPMTMLRMMKLNTKSPKKMAELQPQEKLQAYLDAASKKQNEVFAKWIKDPANKNFMNNQKKKAELMSKSITQQTIDWRNSEEYKRILANNRMADEASAKSKVQVKNNTKSTIYISAGSVAGSFSSISPSGTTTMDCKEDLYYSFEGNTNAKRIKFYSANQSCGGTVEVN
ncbi:MAG: hypothetical protein CMO01_22040 [Thalassobius sp.]|nr:hypothetical protein [Thalassovita sp.]